MSEATVADEGVLSAQLAAAQASIRGLQEELSETNRGLLALTVELEKRVEARVADLRATQEELAKTNSELLQLTLELEDRVAERTAELMARNDELATMSQQLIQAAKLATVGELSASIAHELNNPLATVSLRIESLIGQVSDDDPQRRELEVIEQEVDRMSTLVAGLLQFSRRGAAQISTVDVGEEIDNTLDLVAYLLRPRAIQVRREIAPDVPTVQADRQQLRQLLLNLFTNASDAMPHGGQLTIRVSAAPAPQSVSVEIADTGQGIAPEHLPKVMEPFFTTKPEGKGTGLGLAICRRIAQEHNGTFEITSPGSGQGTTVRVSLPAQNARNAASLDEAWEG